MTKLVISLAAFIDDSDSELEEGYHDPGVHTVHCGH
jgi:hypothetical protein